MKAKIGIIGSGIVAKTLGEGFIKHGYDVMLGTRNQEKLNEWKANEGEGAVLGSLSESASFGDIIVLAVKGAAAKGALELAGANNLSGKTIMDATNPISDAPPVNGVLQFFTAQNDSLMEQLQQSFPDANFVKAFSSVGSAKMANPTFEVKPSMFICGNNAAAKQEVSKS